MERRRREGRNSGCEDGRRAGRFLSFLTAVLLLTGIFQAVPARAADRERPTVQVCGNTVGIYMETDGVMVIDVSQIPTSDGLYADPARNIVRAGDYICAVNGTPLSGKHQLTELVAASGGEAIELLIRRDGQEIPVLSPSTKAAVVSQAVVTYDKLTGEYAIDAGNVAMTTREGGQQKPLYEVDPDLEAALKPYETATWQDYMLQPIGKATGDFSAANLGTAPSAFVDLVNKVQIWGAYDRTGENTPDDESDDTPAQLSITAPLTSGNAENLIPEGDIVLGDMFKLYRYENWFYQITMSGKEVRTWLEYSASKVDVRDDGSVNIRGGLTYYDVIYGEGFSYVIDPSQPEGSRIVSMTYNGEEVADDAEFTVVINNYRYNGGGDYIKYLNEHGCEFEANDPGRIIYSTQYDMIQGEDKGQARNLLADYIREAGEIAPTIESTWSIKLPE